MTALPSAFQAHRTLLWRLCYRMTGNAADADDLVQETFARALERPPADSERDLKPWLIRVAMNLSRDHLRARKRRAYEGPYLPSPIDTSDWPSDAALPDARYGELESVSFAFLHALEVLSAKQRAVLVLCDVSGYSVREAADVLGMSEANVKTTHHRARAALRDYDATRVPPTREVQAQTLRKLQLLLWHLSTRDVQALEALLAADVEALNDGGGEYFAAQVPVRGRAKVALFHLKTQRHGKVRGTIRMINGLPALVAEYAREGLRLRTSKRVAPRRTRVAPRVVFGIRLEPSGNIQQLYASVATSKLTHVSFEQLEAPTQLIAGTLWKGLRDPLFRRELARNLLWHIKQRAGLQIERRSGPSRSVPSRLGGRRRPA
ncbi:MAG TPA: sigma-70 family RNA polymerase sigma factor [Polyangiaceae bacterium]|nr:sigma-70 family RNA polymerase sigma factor [Polyangiaceae bacterium]